MNSLRLASLAALVAFIFFAVTSDLVPWGVLTILVGTVALVLALRNWRAAHRVNEPDGQSGTWLSHRVGVGIAAVGFVLSQAINRDAVTDRRAVGVLLFVSIVLFVVGWSIVWRTWLQDRRDRREHRSDSGS